MDLAATVGEPHLPWRHGPVALRGETRLIGHARPGDVRMCDPSGRRLDDPYYRFNIRLRTGNANGVGTNRVYPSANRTCGPPGTTDPRPCSAAFSASATPRSAETWVNPGSLSASSWASLVAWNSVGTGPGQTAVTVTPFSATSAFTASDSHST